MTEKKPNSRLNEAGLNEKGKRRWPRRTKEQQLARAAELYVEEHAHANDNQSVEVVAPKVPSVQTIWDIPMDHQDELEDRVRGEG
jgi:hypothetical protein